MDFEADVRIELRSIKVEDVSSEAEAERVIEDTISEWMDGYVPMDPEGTLVVIEGIWPSDDDEGDYNIKPGSSKARRPASRAKSKSKPKGSKGVKASKQPRKANGQFAKKSSNAKRPNPASKRRRRSWPDWISRCSTASDRAWPGTIARSSRMRSLMVLGADSPNRR